MKNHAKTCSHVPTKEWMLTKPIPALSTLPCLWPALATHQLYKKSAAYTTQSLKAAQGLKMRCFGCLGRDEKKTMKSGQTPKLSKIFGRRKIQECSGKVFELGRCFSFVFWCFTPCWLLGDTWSSQKQKKKHPRIVPRAKVTSKSDFLSADDWWLESEEDTSRNWRSLNSLEQQVDSTQIMIRKKMVGPSLMNPPGVSKGVVFFKKM